MLDAGKRLLPSIQHPASSIQHPESFSEEESVGAGWLAKERL
jgi:hypothetical protein